MDFVQGLALHPITQYLFLIDIALPGSAEPMPVSGKGKGKVRSMDEFRQLLLHLSTKLWHWSMYEWSKSAQSSATLHASCRVSAGQLNRSILLLKDKVAAASTYCLI